MSLPGGLTSGRPTIFLSFRFSGKSIGLAASACQIPTVPSPPGASPCPFVIPRNVESVDPATGRSSEGTRERAYGRKVTRPGDRPDQIRPGRTGRSRSHEIGEFNNLLRGARGGAEEGKRVGRGGGNNIEEISIFN